MTLATNLKAGDLAVLRMPIKQVAALPGDHVNFTANGIFVNDRLLPNSAPEAGIPHFPFGSYVVPNDFFLGVGTLNPDSYDSRYFGFLPQSLIRGMATPIVTIR